MTKVKIQMYLNCFVLVVTTAVINVVNSTPPMDEHWPCMNFSSVPVDLKKINGDYYLAHRGALNLPQSDLDSKSCKRLHIWTYMNRSPEIVELGFTQKTPEDPLLEYAKIYDVYKGKTGRWVPHENALQISIQAHTDDVLLYVLCLKTDPAFIRNVIYTRWKEITPQRKEEIWKVIRTTNMKFHKDAVINADSTCINKLPAPKRWYFVLE